MGELTNKVDWTVRLYSSQDRVIEEVVLTNLTQAEANEKAEQFFNESRRHPDRYAMFHNSRATGTIMV